MCDESADESLSQNHEFVRRLLALPVMADAFGQLNSFYCGTKERNRLLKLTMETAESGVGAIVNTAHPVLSKFDKQILVLNHIACAQLDRLENNCPIITKPTNEVVKETKELCTGAIQPMVNRVNSVKDYGVRKASGLRDYTGEKIDGIKKYGVDTVAAATKVGSDQVTKVLLTRVCREVLNKCDAALVVADRYLDDYLPEGDEQIGNKEAAEADIAVLSKAYQLSSKVQRRLYARAARRLEKAQLQAKETITKLNLVLQWIELARSNANDAKDKAFQVWQEITKMEDQVVEDAANEEMASHDSTYDRKAIATIRQLVMKLRGIMSWIDASAIAPARAIPGAVQGRLHNSMVLIQALPESVRERVEGLGKMVHSMSDAFSKETVNVKDLPQSVLDNARDTLHQLYDGLTDLVDRTLQNASRYNKIGLLFQKSEKSTSEDGENESTSDQNDDQEKGQKESAEKETSDDEIPCEDDENVETSAENDRPTGEDRQSDNEADGQRSSSDDDDDTDDTDDGEQNEDVDAAEADGLQNEEKTEDDNDRD